MPRKDIAKDGKPFVKGDPRINRKGAPVRKPLADKIQAALDNPGNIIFVGELQYACDDKGKYLPGVKASKGDLVKVRVAVPNEDMIILSLTKEAMKGNVNAAREIWDRIHGKAKQQTEISNPDGSLSVAQINLTIDGKEINLSK